MAATLFKAASLPGVLVGDEPGGTAIGVVGPPDGAFAGEEDVGGAGGELVGAPVGGVAVVGTGAEGGGDTVWEGVGDEM